MLLALFFGGGVFLYFFMAQGDDPVSAIVRQTLSRASIAVPGDDEGEGLRLLALIESFKIFESRFPVGVGYQNLFLHMDHLYQHPIISHSFLATAAGECGFVGVCVFLYFLVVLMRSIRTISRLEAATMWSAEFRRSVAASAFLGTIHWAVRPQLDNMFYFLVLVLVFYGAYSDGHIKTSG